MQYIYFLFGFLFVDNFMTIVTLMISSAWSGLPEPENPTGFGRFSWTRLDPNPKKSQISKPEETRTRSSNPGVPESSNFVAKYC